MEIVTDQRFRKTIKYFRALLIISLIAASIAASSFHWNFHIC